MTAPSKLLRITPEPLTVEAFAPFGDVLRPRSGHQPVTNVDLLNSGRARMSNPVRPDRMHDWDILDYWSDIATISRDTMKFGYIRCRAKAMTFSWFERHMKGTQTLIPASAAKSVLPVIPANAIDDDSGLPDLAKARAFILDGTTAVSIRPGTWHWTPFPLGETADFIYLVREQVVEDDLNFVDTEARLGVRMEVELPPRLA
ncbi:MAG: ureidoglycolate lyase [Burkholderiales bacterium]